MGTPFMAEIKIISWNFAPKGWAFCDGALLPINQNQALFSLLGTTFGGDGRVNFALPDFRGRSPFHVGNGHILGERGGEENHTLTTSEMPAHLHQVQASNASGNLQFAAATSPVAQHNIWGTTAQKPYDSAFNNTMHPGSTSNTGGGQPHNNLQPYLVLNFIIALQGIFPSRN